MCSSRALWVVVWLHATAAAAGSWACVRAATAARECRARVHGRQQLHRGLLVVFFGALRLACHFCCVELRPRLLRGMHGAAAAACSVCAGVRACGACLCAW